MKTLILLILLSHSNLSCSQSTNYCNWTGCSLPADHEAHFDPYYNGHLCENFNPKQIDFSKEYLELQTDRISKIATNITTNIKNYSFDLDSLFNTNRDQQNGLIGIENNRIRIHISKTEQEKVGSLNFVVFGKSNIAGEICPFRGKVEIIKVYEILENYDFNGQAELFARYELYEDNTQGKFGVFKGIFECAIQIDHINKNIKLDESFAVADGYYNRSYVGTHLDKKTEILNKCIWGDYRLPFSFDFDCGDGIMRACEEYVQNGWENFNNDSEYEYDGESYRLKDEWWNEK